MRAVTRNSFARHTITAERMRAVGQTCTECGQTRGTDRPWLYRFHVDDDQGPRQSGPLANGRLFCSRQCAETYIGQPFDETETR